MKRIFPYITLCLTALLTACNGKEEDVVRSGATLKVSSSAPTFVAGGDGASADARIKTAGGDIVLDIISNQEGWEYAVDGAWLSARKEKYALTLSAEANTTGADRTADVAIRTAGENGTAYTVHVLQRTYGTPEITLGQARLTIPAKGQLRWEIPVETNQEEWAFACSSPWLLVSQEEGTLVVTADANTGRAQRSVDVTLTATTPDASDAATLHIDQDGTAYIDLSTAIVSVNPDGGTETVTFETNPELEWSIISEAEGWYHLAQEGNSVTVTVDPKSDRLQRTGAVRLRVGYDENVLEKDIEILQLGTDTDAFILEWYVPSAGSNFALPIGGNDNYGGPCDITVDWGDGSTTRHTGTSLNAHEYEEPGLYTVKVKGSAPVIQVQTSNREYIRKVASWGLLGTQRVHGGFFYCRNLTSIPDDVAGSFAKVTSFYQFLQSCSSLRAIPKDLFRYAVDATEFYYCFADCHALRSLPEDLFRYNTKAETFLWTFRGLGTGDNILEEETIYEDEPVEIPEGLFRNCVNARDMTGLFYHACITTVPAGLFAGCPALEKVNSMFMYTYVMQSVPEGLLKNNPKVEDFYNMFRSSGIKTVPADLFAYTEELGERGLVAVFRDSEIETIPDGLFSHSASATSISGLFYGCTHLKRIDKDAFKGLTAVTVATELFYHCESLEEIPEGLFDDLTSCSNFKDCFAYCYSLKSLPKGLFKYVAGSGTGVALGACFRNTTSLKTVPEDLLAYFPNLTSASNLFWNAGLETIPAGLFSANKKITTFSGCFQGSQVKAIPADLFPNPLSLGTYGMQNLFSDCVNLKTVPAGVFKNLSGSTKSLTVFPGCTALESVPADLFDSFTTATTISRCFYNCSALKSLPQGLFAKNTKVTSADYCFYGCSSLTGESPWVPDVDGIPVHLYERSDSDLSSFLPGYSVITSYTGAFTGCTGLSDYKTIASDYPNWL